MRAVILIQGINEVYVTSLNIHQIKLYFYNNSRVYGDKYFTLYNE
jgi:hypothetical protein